MTASFGRLALHTWTIDTTPLPVALEAARDGGFDAVELRRIDFTRCYERGMSNGSGARHRSARRTSRCARSAANTAGCLPRARRARRLFDVLEETCENAVALDCPQVMCAPGQNAGTPQEAIENLKRGADICGKYGLTLAIEFNSQHAVINSHRGAARDPPRRRPAERRHAARCLSSRAQRRRRPRLHRRRARRDDRVPVQRCAGGAGCRRRQAADRPAAAGAGVVRWNEVLRLLDEKRFDGHLSYEAPNPALWERSPFEVAREGATATRALIAQALA